MNVVFFLSGHVYLQRQMTGATSVSTGTYRDIKSSHLLHKAHSAADSPGGAEIMGTQDTLYTKLKHTFTSYGKRTEARWRRQRREEGERGSRGFRHIFKYKRTYTNRLQALCSHIYSQQAEEQLHDRTIRLRCAGLTEKTKQAI